MANALLKTLATRFANNRARHPGLEWEQVEARLAHHPVAMSVLQRMEETGGEPDVVMFTGGAAEPDVIMFCDCAAESPAGRRSLCYDADARTSRKEAAPVGSALELASTIGIMLLDEAQYVALQQLGAFDRKTSSWLATPPAVRALGGAIFGDRRYERTFVYHNGAQSYYAARGFRGILRV